MRSMQNFLLTADLKQDNDFCVARLSCLSKLAIAVSLWPWAFLGSYASLAVGLAMRIIARLDNCSDLSKS